MPIHNCIECKFERSSNDSRVPAVNEEKYLLRIDFRSTVKVNSSQTQRLHVNVGIIVVLNLQHTFCFKITGSQPLAILN
jgi:hypothetical protein